MNEAVRLDSYLSVYGGFQTQRMRLNALNGLNFVPQDEYVNDGLAALIVDRVAEDAMSRGFTIEGDEDDAILDEMDRLDAVNVLTDGLRWSRLFGSAAVLMLVEDGLSLEDPLDLARIRSIMDLKAYPPLALSRGEFNYTDPTQANYGEPEFFRVQARGGDPFLVHESRFLRFPGDPLSHHGAVNHVLPWHGRSALKSCWDDLSRYREALRLNKLILERKQQPIYQMQGLGEMMAAGLEDVVKSRLALTDLVRSLMTTVAVDAEDKFTIADSSLAGIGDVMRDFKIALSASSGIPMAVLFGEMAGGLTTTDEGAQGIYHQRVRQTQERCLRPAMERLVSILWAQRSVAAVEPKHWSIEFNPLWSPKETDIAAAKQSQANARKAEVEALDALITAQIITNDEARDHARRAWPELELPNTAAPEPVVVEPVEPEPDANPAP